MKYLITLTFLLSVIKSHAEFIVSNVSFIYTGMQIVVTYDLTDGKGEMEVDAFGRSKSPKSMATGNTCFITAEFFGSGNKFDAYALSGDVGKNISLGKGKKIIWNTKADNINFSGELSVEVIAKTQAHVSTSTHVVRSMIFPGLGNYRLDNKNFHFLLGIGAYGATVGSVLYNQHAVSSYDSYKNSLNALESNRYFNQAQQSQLASFALAGTAAAIWTYSAIKTYNKAKKIKSYDRITSAQSKYYYAVGEKINYAFSPRVRVDIKGIYFPPELTFETTQEQLDEIVVLNSAGEKINTLKSTELIKLKCNIRNNGKGDALNVVVNTAEINGLKGIDFVKELQIGTVRIGETKTIEIPISTNNDLITSVANFIISVKEANGFGIDPISLKINTKEFLAPKLEVMDYKFLSEKGGNAKRGEKIFLKVNIQNTGFGDAKNVSVDFKLPIKNVFPVNETQHTYNLIKSGAHVSIDLEFFTNKEFFDTTVSIDIQLRESWGRFAESKKVTVVLNQELAKRELSILGDVSYNAIIKPAMLTSDVDVNIPVNNEKRPYKYAIVIGNEDYVSRQPSLQSEANVEFAEQDAKIMKEYLLRTLGFEEQKVFLLVNATASEMRKELTKIEQIFTRLPNGVDSEIIFYYAGHGYPDEVTKIPYLIPVDVSATDIQNGLRLSEITQRLGSVNAKKVTIILDACFTGDGRNAGLLAARTARIKPKSINLQGNMVVFSASSGDQTALPYKEKKHGYFTYFILKKLQETKGNLSYGDLSDYVTTNVQLETTIKIKPQDPQINASEIATNTWRNWRLR